MLKILFSPSEAKKTGGNEEKKELFGALDAREEILKKYQEILLCNDELKIKELFGLKKYSECEQYLKFTTQTELMPAIERYNGVAYDYLNYISLNHNQQNYLKENTIIFSNLYGPILGKDPIINYKVKQGNNIGKIMPEKYYKERFSYQLDLYLANNEILDLRAGYYNKFYKTTKEYTTLKFLKNGKSVSHWAKAYRGVVLREVGKYNINSIKEFMALNIDGLKVHEIIKTKNKTEIIYNIIS